MSKIYKCDYCKGEIGLPGPFFLKYPELETGEMHSATFCTFYCLTKFGAKMQKKFWKKVPTKLRKG